jgi:hypothetical protein
MPQRDAMTMPQDVAAFIEGLPPSWSYSQLADACRARFGADAAPDADAIRAWWVSRAGASGARSHIARDAEVAGMIRDLAGRLPPAAILAELRQRFPAHRIPRRSTFYRHVALLLREARRAR